MALTLVKEDGSGLATANTYATVAEGDSYFEGHLYATAWTAAATANKGAALVMATRMMDACFVFGGRKANDDQALQWPRYDCVDRDAPMAYNPLRMAGHSGGYFDETSVPACVSNACCELAKDLLVAERTEDWIGAGLRSTRLGDAETVFDRRTRPGIMSAVVVALLQKVGAHTEGGAGVVRLTRM